MHHCKVWPRGSAVKLLLDVSLVMDTWAEFPDKLLSVQRSLAQVLKQRRILETQYTDPQWLEFYTPHVKSEEYFRKPQFSLLNRAASSLLFSFSSFAHKLKATTLRKEAGLRYFLKSCYVFSCSVVVLLLLSPVSRRWFSWRSCLSLCFRVQPAWFLSLRQFTARTGESLAAWVSDSSYQLRVSHKAGPVSRSNVHFVASTCVS